MSEKKFNVAMIGCGAIADFHLQGILEKKECELYAVCDSATDDRLERRAKKYGAPRMVKDYMELHEMECSALIEVGNIMIKKDDLSFDKIKANINKAGTPL